MHMAKTAQIKPDRRKTVTRRKPPAAAAITITDEAIAAKAFEYYCSRGGAHGGDLDDWLAAERDLRTPPASAEP